MAKERHINKGELVAKCNSQKKVWPQFKSYVCTFQ
uniref:Uncharacterized protein n=1 Tax=Rhizophora mucronata TaxID=61149 RepID=A0A2P2QCV2_RHIMU